MELRCTGREGRLPAGWGRKGTAARIAGWKAVIQSARLLQGRSPCRRRAVSLQTTEPGCHPPNVFGSGQPRNPHIPGETPRTSKLLSPGLT